MRFDRRKKHRTIPHRKPQSETETEEAKLEIDTFLEKFPFEYQARSIFKNVNTLAAAGGKNPEVGQDLMRSVDRFLSKGGGTFMDYKNAEKEFTSSKHFTSLKKEINANFEEALINNQGTIRNLKVKVPEPPIIRDLSEQMLALFGGTQYLELELNHWKLSDNNESYTGRIFANIFDVYGVSEDDLTKENPYIAELAGAKKGLIAMWVLQNKHNYIPLQNGMQIIIPISGSTKKNQKSN